MRLKNWSPIKGYEGIYEVSKDGVIKSLSRKGVRNDRILTLSKDSNGYVYAILSKNGKGKQKALHRILYENFKGDLIDGLVIDHIDNNKLNNSLDNLQQITIRENASKDRGLGTSKYLGVSFDKKRKKFRANIYNGKIRKHLGYFDNEIKASEAYQKEKQILLDELNKEIKNYE